MQIRLVRGAGSPETGACWMSALSHYAGYRWSDQPECVDPIIRTLCVYVNDWLPDEHRERVIGPHLFAPIGTQQGRELSERRAFACVDRAVRVYAASDGCADDLRLLSPIVDVDSATKAISAVGVEQSKLMESSMVLTHAVIACCLASERDWLPSTIHAAGAATACAWSLSYGTDRLISLILDLCAMGRSEVPQVRSLCDLPQATAR